MNDLKSKLKKKTKHIPFKIAFKMKVSKNYIELNAKMIV